MRFGFISWLFLLATASVSWADQFEHYHNEVLAKAMEEKDKNLKPLTECTSEELASYLQIFSDTTAAMLIVETNDRRLAKLLVQPARQRVGMDQQVPMLLIDKFVTFKEGTERTIKASSQNVHLYPGSRLHLDLGQIVPEKMGGDLLVLESEKNPLGFVLKPIGKAKLFVLTKPIPGVQPKKGDKFVMGEAFDPKYFNGTFKLQDDGRRSGTLKFEVDANGTIFGSFYSDKDGAKYDVIGKIGKPNYSATFSIKFPQIEQTFTGFMFTGNGKRIAGTSKLQDREAAFTADRVED